MHYPPDTVESVIHPLIRVWLNHILPGYDPWDLFHEIFSTLYILSNLNVGIFFIIIIQDMMLPKFQIMNINTYDKKCSQSLILHDMNYS